MMYLRVMKKIKEVKIDAFIISDEANKDWLCNKENYKIPAVLLFTDKEVWMFTKSRNIEAFRELYPEYHVVFGSMPELLSVCNELNIGNVGCEANVLSLVEYREIKESLHNTEIVEFVDFIEDLRMIKTPDEILKLEKAAEISDQAFELFLNKLHAGLNEREARNILRGLLFEMNSDALGFDVLLSSGSRAFLPHSESTDKIIEYGDLVLVDFGIVKDGYCSDTTRTVCIGKADKLQRERYNIVLEAQKYAIDHIASGMMAKDADALARSIIYEAEPKGCYDYGLGHGIGVRVHEKPSMKPDSNIILNKNTSVSVEPGIYIPGWGGIRIEDVIIINDEGEPNIVMSRLNKNLIEID